MDRTKRENAVILFVSRDGPRIRYCNACVDYHFDIHGTCPGSQVYSRACKVHTTSYVDFDNTKHIPVAIYNNPCKGKEFRCDTDCNRCVILKRTFVMKPLQ